MGNGEDGERAGRGRKLLYHRGKVKAAKISTGWAVNVPSLVN